MDTCQQFDGRRPEGQPPVDEQPKSRVDRVRGRVDHHVTTGMARLEAGRRTSFFVAIGRRYVRIGGSTYAALLAIELFTTVLPLIIIGFGYMSRFAEDASLGTIFVRQLGVQGTVAQAVQDAFGASDALRSTWTVVGMAGWLFWGIPMSLTVAAMFGRAWQRDAFPAGQRLWRGGVWFLLYLAVLMVRERIAFDPAVSLAWRLLLYLASLVPVWAFWAFSPVLLVKDGARNARFVVRAGLAGVVIDGVVIALANRLIFPQLLAGWTAFGPIGVAMAIMTWCGVLGIGWVVTACVGAVIWERAVENEVPAE